MPELSSVERLDVVETLHLLMTPSAQAEAHQWVQTQDTVVVFDRTEPLPLRCRNQYLMNAISNKAPTITTEELAQLIARFDNVKTW